MQGIVQVVQLTNAGCHLLQVQAMETEMVMVAEVPKVVQDQHAVVAGHVFLLQSAKLLKAVVISLVALVRQHLSATGRRFLNLLLLLLNVLHQRNTMTGIPEDQCLSARNGLLRKHAQGILNLLMVPRATLSLSALIGF